METKEKVPHVMKQAGRSMRTGEIASVAGADNKEAEKSIKSLSREDKVYSPARCLWQAK